MKKFILLSMLSVFFYSTPGYTGRHGKRSQRYFDEKATQATKEWQKATEEARRIRGAASPPEAEPAPQAPAPQAEDLAD